MTRPVVEVLRAGPLTLVQDAGRPGWAHLGVPRSGAADLPALRRANVLVGNGPDAAALEVLLGGLMLRFPAGGTAAVTGAEVRVAVAGPDGQHDEARLADPADPPGPVALPPGGTLRLGRATRGLRAYVAVRGGIDVPPVLGSRSRDTLAGLGPAPLLSGDALPIGRDAGRGGRGEPSGSRPDGPAGVRWPPGPLRVLLGPRDDWLDDDAVRRLADSDWTVSPDSDRVGVRLSGPPLARRVLDELPSEGLVLGALQVPPEGRPILMLADHPVTGGYPVIGVVAPADLPAAAQARPGDRLRFVVVG